MLKRRIVYIIWWIILLLYFFFRADMISVCLIIFTLVLTAATAFTAYLASKKLSAGLNTEEEMKAGINYTAKLELNNSSRLPVFYATAVLKCRTKDDSVTQGLNAGFYLGIKEKSNLEIDIKCDSQGELILSVNEILFMDIFGVICFRKKFNIENILTVIADNQEEITDEQPVSDSKETKTEHEEENGSEQV